MMSTNRMLTGLIFLTTAIAAQDCCRAQDSFAGPTGTFTSDVSGAANAVWDAESLFVATNVNSIIYRNGGVNAIVDYPIALTQDGKGKVSGQGTNSVSLTYWSGYSFVVLDPFPASYKVAGSMVSRHGTTRCLLKRSVIGMADINGESRKVKAASTVTFTFDNAAGTYSAIRKDSVAAAGLHGASSQTGFGSSPLTNLIAGDGSWTSTMTLSTTGKTVGGSAVVALNSGQTLQFSVKGVYKAATQQSKLLLSGTGASQGSVLRVVMDAGRVTSLKGKLLGQMVSAFF